MVATAYNEKRKAITRATQRPGEKFFDEVLSREEENKAVVATYDSLRKDGYAPIKIEEKFSMADMSNIYASAYWLFSLYSHANASALEEGHIEKVDEENIRVVVFKDVGPDHLVRYLDTLLSVWIDSSVKIHSELKSSQVERYRGLTNSLMAARKQEGFI